MGARLAIAFGVVAALFAGGYVAQSCLFADDPVSSAAAPAPNVPPPAEIEPRAELTPAPSRPVARAVKVEGNVQRRSGDGEWIAVEPGATMSSDDALRTGDGGELILELGDDVTVMVPERTEVVVGSVSEALSRLNLDRGRVTAVVEGNSGSRLEVATSDGDAVASASDGEFSVLSSETGEVTVATVSGEVEFSAGGEVVVVPAGRQSVARSSLPPSAPRVIPPSLYLKLRPVRSKQRSTRTTIRGETIAGAVISINGVDYRTEADGRFAASVVLREGKNRLTVRADDVVGRTRTRTSVVEVDTSVDLESRVEW